MKTEQINPPSFRNKNYEKIVNRKALYYKGSEEDYEKTLLFNKFLIELYFTPQKTLFFEQNFTPSKSGSAYL